MIREVLGYMGEDTIEGIKAAEYRVLFLDPTRPLSRTPHVNQALVGMFRLSLLQNKSWYVPHVKILTAFLSYLKSMKQGDVRILSRVIEPSMIDDKQKERYNAYEISDHRLTFGPFATAKEDRYIHIYDGQGGCTGYCRYRDANYVKDVIELIQSPGGMDKFLIQMPKARNRLDLPENVPMDNSLVNVEMTTGRVGQDSGRR